MFFDWQWLVFFDSILRLFSIGLCQGKGYESIVIRLSRLVEGKPDDVHYIGLENLSLVQANEASFSYHILTLCVKQFRTNLACFFPLKVRFSCKEHASGRHSFFGLVV